MSMSHASHIIKLLTGQINPESDSKMLDLCKMGMATDMQRCCFFIFYIGNIVGYFTVQETTSFQNCNVHNSFILNYFLLRCSDQNW